MAGAVIDLALFTVAGDDGVMPQTEEHLDILHLRPHSCGLPKYLWKLEQPARAVADGYFIGAINRVGREQPGLSASFMADVFCTPREIIVEGSRDSEEVVADTARRPLLRNMGAPATYRGLLTRAAEATLFHVTINDPGVAASHLTDRPSVGC